MSRIELSDGMKTCHTDMDRDHQVLIELLNQLHEAFESGRDREICDGIIHELLEYAIKHFSMEEKLMAKHLYSDIGPHKAQHAFFLKMVLDYKSEADAHWRNVGASLQDFLGNWLIGHIMRFDKDLAAEIFKLQRRNSESLDKRIAGIVIRDKLGHK